MRLSRRALVAGAAGAVTEPCGQGRFNTLDSPSGAAIKGYDPVAHFVDSAPRRERAGFAVDYGGVRRLFACAVDKRRF